MSTFTLGRLLSIIMPGFLAIWVIGSIASSTQLFGALTTHFSSLAMPDSFRAFILSAVALCIGIAVDHFRVWYMKSVFVRHLNFYGLFRYWYKPHYLCSRLLRRPLKEDFKSFEYWHKNYEEAYNEAYKFWLYTNIEQNPQAIDLARKHDLKHVLFGLHQIKWQIGGANGTPAEKMITITSGQIWPILATKQKEAFRFYQEYFFSDLAANVLIVTIIGIDFAVIGFMLNGFFSNIEKLNMTIRWSVVIFCIVNFSLIIISLLLIRLALVPHVHTVVKHVKPKYGLSYFKDIVTNLGEEEYVKIMLGETLPTESKYYDNKSDQEAFNKCIVEDNARDIFAHAEILNIKDKICSLCI